MIGFLWGLKITVIKSLLMGSDVDGGGYAFDDAFSTSYTLKD